MDGGRACAQNDLVFAARADDGSASDRLSLRQRVEPAVPVSVWQGAFIRLEGEQSLPVALPAGALPGQGGVRVSVQSRLAFGALLLGRWRHGWRGTRAVGWTLAAMALLVLAFFGSKFVLELILQRTV